MSELEPTRTYSNRTGLGPDTLARSLRRMAGDGSVEWVHEPIQASVLRDIADILDSPRLPYWWTHDGTLHIDSTRMPLRIVVNEGGPCEFVPKREADAENARLRELVRDVWHLFTEHGAVHPYDLPKVDAVRDRMHELEVEVES